MTPELLRAPGCMGAAGWVGMAFMILFWIAVVVGIAYLVWYLVKRARWSETASGSHERPPEPPPAVKSDALRLLEERYARGEIDREEFLRRKVDLTS